MLVVPVHHVPPHQALEQPGNGGVLVVDGGASMRCALLGDNIAEMAYKNGWSVCLIVCVAHIHLPYIPYIPPTHLPHHRVSLSMVASVIVRILARCHWGSRRWQHTRSSPPSETLGYPTSPSALVERLSSQGIGCMQTRMASLLRHINSSCNTLGCVQRGVAK